MLNRILGWSRAAKRMVVVAMDICLGVIAMWLAFTLRLETPHWPSGMQWLAYALAPALAAAAAAAAWCSRVCIPTCWYCCPRPCAAGST